MDRLERTLSLVGDASKMREFIDALGDDDHAVLVVSAEGGVAVQGYGVTVSHARGLLIEADELCRTRGGERE